VHFSLPPGRKCSVFTACSPCSRLFLTVIFLAGCHLGLLDLLSEASLGLSCRTLETLKFLVAEGANPGAKDFSGETPIDILPPPPPPSQRSSEPPTISPPPQPPSQPPFAVHSHPLEYSGNWILQIISMALSHAVNFSPSGSPSSSYMCLELESCESGKFCPSLIYPVPLPGHAHRRL
jgi:hypothetical protein